MSARYQCDRTPHETADAPEDATDVIYLWMAFTLV
jgi:hypothetical protein